MEEPKIIHHIIEAGFESDDFNLNLERANEIFEFISQFSNEFTGEEIQKEIDRFAKSRAWVVIVLIDELRRKKQSDYKLVQTWPPEAARFVKLPKSQTDQLRDVILPQMERYVEDTQARSRQEQRKKSVKKEAE